MTTLTPYLNFPGTAEAALNYYAEALGGQILFIQRFGDMPGGAQPGQAPNHVLHAEFVAEGVRLLVSDGPDVPTAPEARTYLSLDFTDGNQIDRVFALLAEGGQVQMPLQDTFWNARFGICIDKFGIAWMCNHDLAPKEPGQPETLMA